MSGPEPIAVTLKVVDVLESLGVRYLIGGSMASAAYGVPRSTMDADVLAELRGEHIEALVSALRPEFHVDPESALEAIGRRSSFNVIHLETMFKVDIFISGDTSFELGELTRRVRQRLAAEQPRAAYFATPEDTIAAKLQRYRRGGEVSERQWRDLGDVLRVQGHALDLELLRSLAEDLGVADLLHRALVEAGLQEG